MGIAPDFTSLRQPISATCTPVNGSHRSGLGVSVISNDCVEITAGNNKQGSVQKQEAPLSPPADCGETAETPFRPQKTSRQGSLDSDSGLPLKGILKQRSTSGMFTLLTEDVFGVQAV